MTLSGGRARPCSFSCADGGSPSGVGVGDELSGANADEVEHKEFAEISK